MNINKIDIVSVPVTDQQESKEFYEKVLGFEVVKDNPMPPDRRWVPQFRYFHYVSYMV